MTKQRKTLSAEDRKRILYLKTTKKFTNEELARGYGVSTRTVERIMETNGIDVVHLRMTTENAKMIAVIKEHKIKSAAKLDQALRVPPLTMENVQLYLNGCSKDQLAQHFYISGLHILQQIAGEASQQHHAKVLAEQQATSTPNVQPQPMRDIVKNHLAS